MVYEKLKRGRNNAITSSELLALCGFNNIRDLRGQIAKERNEGFIICSTTAAGGGYYLPESRKEIQEFVASMSKRAKSTFLAIRNARRLLKECEGQTSIESDKLV